MLCKWLFVKGLVVFDVVMMRIGLWLIVVLFVMFVLLFVF